MGDVLVWLVWFVAAVGCLGSGVAVISFSNPFYSAIAIQLGPPTNGASASRPM